MIDLVEEHLTEWIKKRKILDINLMLILREKQKRVFAGRKIPIVVSR